MGTATSPRVLAVHGGVTHNSTAKKVGGSSIASRRLRRRVPVFVHSM
jgi:hypothetical protein